MEAESVAGSFATVPVVQRDLSTSDSQPSPPNMSCTSSLPLLENTRGYHCYHPLSSSELLGGVLDERASNAHSGRVQPRLSMDLVENIKGMYRLLGLTSESGSSDCGNEL